MEALFLKVLELSVYGGLLILAILPVRLLLRRAPRWSICLLWALAALALVCPIRFESSTSVLPAAPITSTIITPALPTVQTEPIFIEQLPVENGVHILAPEEPDSIAIGAAVWLIGMSVMLFAAAISYLRLMRRVAASINDAENVYICDDIDTPFILGLLRPRIYLPSALDAVTTRQVLLHERAHLKRRDHLWKPLGYLLLTLHWFNPLVWVGYGLLCRDIELACDERVVRDMDTQDKKYYSEALLRCSMPRHLIAACPLAFGEVGVKQRIKAVLQYKRPAFWMIVIALVLCLVLAVTFLTEPKITTLGEMSDVTAADMEQITLVYTGNNARSVTKIDAVCKQLSQLELHRRLNYPHEREDWNVLILMPQVGDAYYHLTFTTDGAYLILWQFDAEGNRQGSYYEVLNPEILTGILHSEIFYTVEDTVPNDSLTAAEMETLIHEFLRNKNRYYTNLQLLGTSLYDPNSRISYTLISLDNTTHDGVVTTTNSLYLMSFTNGRVDGMASGEWGMSAGYYPNVVDLNDRTVLWTTRNATHMAVNDDGSVDPNKLVANAYTEYRITCDNGAVYDWQIAGGAGICVLPQGAQPVKVAPVDSSGNEVEALAFEGNNLTMTSVRTISEVSGWDVFLQMDSETGEIEILGSYPLYSDSNLYIDMDESFKGHEALYATLKNKYGGGLASGLNALHDALNSRPASLKLLGYQSYGDYEYAVIQFEEDRGVVTALVEYSVDGNAVTLRGYSEGDVPNETGMLHGYRMNCAIFNNRMLYWSLYAPRYAVSADGTEVDHTKTVTPKFTAFQFTMFDLETHTFPAAESFFLAEFTTTLLPAIVTPAEGRTTLNALGSEPFHGSRFTIDLTKD